MGLDFEGYLQKKMEDGSWKTIEPSYFVEGEWRCTPTITGRRSWWEMLTREIMLQQCMDKPSADDPLAGMYAEGWETQTARLSDIMHVDTKTAEECGYILNGDPSGELYTVEDIMQLSKERQNDFTLEKRYSDTQRFYEDLQKRILHRLDQYSYVIEELLDLDYSLYRMVFFISV